MYPTHSLALTSNQEISNEPRKACTCIVSYSGRSVSSCPYFIEWSFLHQQMC